MEKKELKKYSVKTKFFRAITYGVLVLLHRALLQHDYQLHP